MNGAPRTVGAPRSGWSISDWRVGDLVLDWSDGVGLVIDLEYREVLDSPEHAIGTDVELIVLTAGGSVDRWAPDWVRRRQPWGGTSIQDIWTLPTLENDGFGY